MNARLAGFLLIQMETQHLNIVVWVLMVFSFSVMFGELYSNGNLRQIIELHETALLILYRSSTWHDLPITV
jgi:hypothetical protein